MSNGRQSGPLLADSENVYRAILYPSWWVEDKHRPSSAAFDEEMFSVDVKSRTTPLLTAARFRSIIRIAEFKCGEGKAIGFESRDELDPNQPDNLAHAHVYFLDYHSTSPSQRKKRARSLAEKCKEVVV
jgi:hypothetical protein